MERNSSNIKAKTNQSNGTIKPIFRWAGGKSWLIKKINEFLPIKFNNYHEPFVGGGAIFFHLRPSGSVYLSDTNYDLINAYSQIRDNVEDVIAKLKLFRNTQEDYYEIRETVFESLIDQAARFFFLNQTCFNGLYRVNLQGKFNVPYGYRTSNSLLDFDLIRIASTLLKPAILNCYDFEYSLENEKAVASMYVQINRTIKANKKWIKAGTFFERLVRKEDELLREITTADEVLAAIQNIGADERKHIRICEDALATLKMYREKMK